MQNSSWQINGNRASLTAGDLSAILDLTRPDIGLSQLRLAGQPWPGSALGVSIDSGGNRDDKQSSLAKRAEQARQPSEAYARGNDLVATYESTKHCPVRFQVYWRMANLGNATEPAIVEAIVSVQTPLLETYPTATVSSVLEANSYLYCAENGDQLLPISSEADPSEANDRQAESITQVGVALATLGDSASYAEMAHPADFLNWQIASDNLPTGCQTVWSLCDQFMEKGVIRRLRLRGLFYQRVATEAELLKQLAQLASEQPPLTV